MQYACYIKAEGLSEYYPDSLRLFMNKITDCQALQIVLIYIIIEGKLVSIILDNSVFLS